MVMGEQTSSADVVVIGGGPGGYSAAFRAADLGLDVTIVDAEDRLGGVCLLRGCIPSKALLEASEVVSTVRRAADWGLQFGEPDVNVEQLRDWKESVVDQLVGGLEELCESRGIEHIRGRAEFTGSNTIRVHEAGIDNIEFEHAVIATGSRPAALPDVEFSNRIVSSVEALDLEDVPDRLLVIGGGYIGLEMGTVYATLGSDVVVVEMTDRLLPRTDPELVAPLRRRLDDLFEGIYLETKVEQLIETDDGVEATFAGGDAENGTFDRILVAVGRAPNVDHMGLEQAGVELDDDDFIEVDDRQRTASNHIYAIGDVTGEPLLAHRAMRQGKVAAEVIAGEPAAYDERCVPAVIYTDPQIAWCGIQEDDDGDRSIEVARFPWKASGRALTIGEGHGLTKLMFDAESGRLLGVGIVGRQAEALIAEGVVAIEMGATARDLSLSIHPHPTLSESIAEAAEAYLGLATHLQSSR